MRKRTKDGIKAIYDARAKNNVGRTGIGLSPSLFTPRLIKGVLDPVLSNCYLFFTRARVDNPGRKPEEAGQPWEEEAGQGGSPRLRRRSL